jgi:hypothetical protein
MIQVPVTSAALANCATVNAAIANKAPKPVLNFIVIAIPCKLIHQRTTVLATWCPGI